MCDNVLCADWLDAVDNDIRQINQENGFGEQERTFLEDIALLHSEISEAADEHSQGRDHLWHGQGGKPEGVPSELADVFIRCLDTCNRYDIELDVEAINAEIAQASELLKCPSERLLVLHSLTSIMMEAYRKGALPGEGAVQQRMEILIARLFAFSGHFGAHLQTEVTRKCDFNRTRSHKHGDKVI